MFLNMRRENKVNTISATITDIGVKSNAGKIIKKGVRTYNIFVHVFRL